MINLKLTGKFLAASLLAFGSVQAGFFQNFMDAFKGTSSYEEPNVGILIAHDVPGIVLEVKGRYKIFDPHTQEFISNRYVGKRKFVQAIADGIKWGEEFPSIHQIQIVPDDSRTATLVDGIEYSGLITVYDIGGTISIVNDVPLEEYLKTIMNPYYFDMPEELAAAYVIAERTGTWYQLKNPPSRYFTIDRENVNYRGKAAAIREEGFSKVIQSTQNMIMTKDKQPFQVQLLADSKVDPNSRPPLGKLTYEQALELARQGKHAAQILNQAYPGSVVTFGNTI